MFLKQTAYKPKPRSNSQSSTSSGTAAPTDEASPTTTPKPRTSSQTQAWEDRRFMFPSGNSGRKSSFSAITETMQKASPFAISKPNNSENPHPTTFVKSAASPVESTPAPAPALRDRHVIWSKGREVHQGAAERRKSSASSAEMKSGMLGNLSGFGGGTGK